MAFKKSKKRFRRNDPFKSKFKKRRIYKKSTKKRRIVKAKRPTNGAKKAPPQKKATPKSILKKNTKYQGAIKAQAPHAPYPGLPKDLSITVAKRAKASDVNNIAGMSDKQIKSTFQHTPTPQQQDTLAIKRADNRWHTAKDIAVKVGHGIKWTADTAGKIAEVMEPIFDAAAIVNPAFAPAAIGDTIAAETHKRISALISRHAENPNNDVSAGLKVGPKLLKMTPENTPDMNMIRDARPSKKMKID